jgi:hypothetical protein
VHCVALEVYDAVKQRGVYCYAGWRSVHHAKAEKDQHMSETGQNRSSTMASRPRRRGSASA